MASNTTEKGLETLIVEHLVADNRYEHGVSTDYNSDYALDTACVERFLTETQPKEVAESLAFASPHNKHNFFERLKNEISKRGIIDVLRKGYRYNTNHFLTLTLGCRKAFFNVENRLFAIFFIFISKYLILMR